MPVAGSPNSLAESRLNTSLPATTTQTFQYDVAGQLVYESRTGAADSYWTYDNAGNRTVQGTGPQTTNYTYDADNRLLSTVSGSVTTTFTYDANGSMTGRNSPGETLSYSWDAVKRMTGIVRNGSNQTTFAVACPEAGRDGDGNRRTKCSGGHAPTDVKPTRWSF